MAIVGNGVRLVSPEKWAASSQHLRLRTVVLAAVDIQQPRVVVAAVVVVLAAEDI